MITISIIACVFALVAVLTQMSRDLMMLQQNSYRDERYVRWLDEAKESTAYDRLLALVLAFVSMTPYVPIFYSCIAIGAFSLWQLLRLFLAKYKKPLVWTPRAKRIYGVSILIVALLYLVPFFFLKCNDKIGVGAVYLMVPFAFSYLVIRMSNYILRPIERSINNKYIREATDILKSKPDLKIIGVTGSYGKTSTKHYLYRILSEKYDVLMTPGNFNTTLGVVRTVREMLKPYTEVFIVEMGAKQKGDIKEICDLAHPSVGIVTAVGPMHLETFGSIENVRDTKFELIDSLPKDGLAVVNNDFEQIALREVDNVECLRYSVKPSTPADYHVTNLKYDAHGTSFVINDSKGAVLELRTSLVGECNVSNLMGAAIVALRMGVEPEKIRYAVEKIEQVEHRLNMKRLPNGITIIDDAYNSNPVGSKMALDVLSAMTTGRRIVITPGMIELGNDQEELNIELGRNIASSVDVAIIVGEYNRNAILKGIKEGNLSAENVHTVNTFQQAQSLMLSFAKPGDVVLYENDLPDTFK